MPSPIYPRLLLLIGGTTFVIGLLMALLAARILGAVALDIAARNQLAHLHHNAPSLWSTVDDPAAFQARVEILWGHLEEVDWVIGQQGAVAASGLSTGTAEALLKQAEESLASGLGRASTTHTRQRSVLVTSRSPSGWVFALRYRPLTAPRQRQLVALILLGVLATAVASSVLSSWFFARPLQRRLEILRHALRRYGDGDKGRRLDVPDRPHELSSLYETFNTMANRITALESEAKSRRRRQRTLLAGLAHDINTPMTVLRGASEILLDRSSLDAQQREVVSTMAAQTLDVQALVDDLLALTAKDDDSLRLSFVNVDLDVLIDDLADTFAPAASRRCVALFGDGYGLSVRADALRLRQMLTNLIRNSLVHGVGVSTVEISARQTEDAVEISVQDDGVGVHPDQLPHLFEPFWRGEVENTNLGDAAGIDPDRHWGLGLAIVQLLAEMHGGGVRYRSADPGARFTLVLPKCAQGPPAEAPQ